MSNIKITMKDPDTLSDCVKDAIEAEVKTLGLPDDEAEVLVERRTEKAMEVCGKWFQYGEYLTVEVNTEAGTCSVCELN